MTVWLHPSAVDDGGAKHLVPGLRLPAVQLPATTGQPITPAEAPGWNILYIYPWTGRPGVSNPPGWDHIPGAHGSTPESEGFRDLHPKFEARGARVFGLSGQSGEEQREFANRVNLPFPILSDAHFTFADALSLPRFQTGGSFYLTRLTLIIRDGVIANVFYPILVPPDHPLEVLAALEAMTGLAS